LIPGFQVTQRQRDVNKATEEIPHVKSAIDCYHNSFRIYSLFLDLKCNRCTFQDMKTLLIIVPDGGMLFEAAGIADILMQANRLHADGLSQPRYRFTLATTQPHQVIHGQSGLNLLADSRLHEIDPREPWDTIMITGRGEDEYEGTAVVDWLRLAAPMRDGWSPFAVARCCWPRRACSMDEEQPPTGDCWKPCKRAFLRLPSKPASVCSGWACLDFWRCQFGL
jgi:hypothetical protein